MKAEYYSRPVSKTHLEIADTFQDAGTRPIEESPDYLIPAKGEINLSQTPHSDRSKTN